MSMEMFTSSRNHAGNRARGLVALTMALPLTLLLPLILGHPYGPVVHVGNAGSAYYLDLWAALSIAGSLVLAVPGCLMAYRRLGAPASAGVLIWLLLIMSFAYFEGRWIS
jgi:hypothetical protein